MALPAACAPLLADETVCMTLAVKALESKPSSLSQSTYGPGVAEEDDALFVLDDGDALRVVWIVVPGAGIGITVSAFEWDEFVGIVVDHGYSPQIHLVAVYDRQTRRCAWEWRGTGMKAVGKWSVFDLGIARVESLEDLVEQGFGLRLELF